MISVAMIGAGIIGESHLSAVAAHAESYLCAVADLIPERATAAALPYGAAAYTDYLEMLDTEKPDAVIINLPHSLHEVCVLDCAARQIHVLLEKPMSISAQSCRHMDDFCQQAGIVLQIGHIQRYIPENRAARAVIASGRLGQPVMIHDLRVTPYFTPNRPRWFLQRKMAGGGIWLNYGAHCLDKLWYLTDSPIAHITGNCTWLAEGTDVDGSAQALARTASGVTAAITISGYPTIPTDETMIFGSEGSLRLRTGTGLWIASSGHYEQVDIGSYPNPFLAQWSDFVLGIACGQALYCSGSYGSAIVEKIESVWADSASAAQAPVSSNYNN